MYIAVCDDQAEELALTAGLLSLWQQERNTPLHFKLFRSAAEMLDAAEREPFTLYLLDVVMPGMDGIAAAREIRAINDTADIVFLSSSSHFAYESYGVKALDYLLKPLHADVFFPLLDRISLREQKPQEGIALKAGNTLTRVLFSQLVYVEVIGKHLYFNLADGSVLEVFGTLQEYEPLLLCRPEFMRTHRSYIVNMFQAAEFSPAGVRTFSGKNLPVSRRLYPQVQKDYMKLLFAGREA